MQQKQIVSIGFNFPGSNYLSVQREDIRSNISLCDADIIILEPNVLGLYKQDRLKYSGKPKISQDDSYTFAEDMNHWQQELNIALENGKTVFVFLSEIEKFYTYYHGKKTISNYEILPIKVQGLESKKGNQIRIAQNLNSLATYWHNFSKHSKYQVYFEGNRQTTVFKTKTGNKAVGAIIPVKKGNLVLLPYLEFNEQLQQYNVDEYGEYYDWNDKGKLYGQQLLASIVEIDKFLTSGQAYTPPPDWSDKPVYKLRSEIEIEARIIETNNSIERLKQQLKLDQSELTKQVILKQLLYEKGKPLEAAILEALNIIGFSAENYQDEESEFDAVFSSEEGKFIGEAEGKDNKPVNVTKLSQLVREIQEDFDKEEVSEYAKGVLFGNAFRLEELDKRKEFFTQKCLNGAIRFKFALVKTPDLFPIAKYLKENEDPNFAKLCRKAIAETEGEVVVFPNIPADN